VALGAPTEALLSRGLVLRTRTTATYRCASCGDLCQLSGMPVDGEKRLEQLDRELHAALDALEPILSEDALAWTTQW
jgi:hypothetical protein